MSSAIGIDLSATKLSAGLTRSGLITTGLLPASEQVPALLRDVSDLYPEFENWLQRRLVDVRRGRAHCSVVASGGQVVGVAINTPKTIVRHKLSTIYVAPEFRGLGLGRLLFEKQMQSWHQAGARNYYVTVRENRAEPLVRLCWHYGLQPIAIDRDRYGVGQHEVVLAKRGIPTWVALF